MNFSYKLASGVTTNGTSAAVAVPTTSYPDLTAYVMPAAGVTCSVVIQGLPAGFANDGNAIWIPLTDAITAAGGYVVRSFPLMRATYTTNGALTIGLEGPATFYR